MAGLLKTSLTTLAMSALALACVTDKETQPVERADSTPVVERVWPESWPVPPLPVMALEHPSGLVWGSPSTYCWHLEDESDRVCHEYTFWTGLDAYPEVVLDEQIRVRVDSETRPDKMFAQVYTRHGNIMVDFIQLGTTYPVLDLDPGPRGLPHPPHRTVAVQRDDQLHRTAVRRSLPTSSG